MELRVMEYFMAVAREQNISAAAKYLNLTQPTLSRQLKELEDELGKQLFIRGTRGKKITLTEEGQIFRKRAREILDLTDRVKEEIKLDGQAISGNIYIGSGETDAVRYIAETAREIRLQHSDIHFHIVSGDSDDLLSRLDSGLFDFCLLLGAIDQSKYEYLPLPWQDTWGILMQDTSHLARREAVTPEDLWEKPLIVSRQIINFPGFFKWFQRTSDELNIIGTYNLAYNASLMAKAGMGYVLTLDKLINTEGNSGLCFRPLSPSYTVGMALVWKKYQLFSRASQYFLEQLQHRYIHL